MKSRILTFLAFQLAAWVGLFSPRQAHRIVRSAYL